LQCCGTQGPTDWASSKYAGGDGKKYLDLTVGRTEQKYKIPPSCCRVAEEDAVCVAGRQAVFGAQVSEVIYSDVSIFYKSIITYFYKLAYFPILWKFLQKSKKAKPHKS